MTLSDGIFSASPRPTLRGCSARRSAGMRTCTVPSLLVRRGHARARACRLTLSTLMPRRFAASP